MRDLSRDREWLAINTATVKSWSLEQAVAGCARAGIPAIAPWRDILQECGVARAARLIRDARLTVTCLCRGGMFTAADEAGRRAALDDNRRAVDEAAAIGAGSLILVAGGLPAGSKDLAGAHGQVRDGIAAVLPHARSAGVALAIEPLHPMTAADRACVNTLAHANDLCDALGEGVGVAIDAYHVWWNPDLPRQVARRGTRILSYHVCDWLGPPAISSSTAACRGTASSTCAVCAAWSRTRATAGIAMSRSSRRRTGGSAIPTRSFASASSATRPWFDQMRRAGLDACADQY